jgi:hypothetical protein
LIGGLFVVFPRGDFHEVNRRFNGTASGSDAGTTIFAGHYIVISSHSLHPCLLEEN